MHLDLIGKYSKTISQQQPGVAIIKHNFSLTCMAMINLTTGWFKIFEILMYDLDEVTNVNGEYVYKSSAGVSQLFNNTWLCRYPRPCKVVLDNGSEF